MVVRRVLLVIVMLVLLVPATAVAAADYEQIVDLTFPVEGPTSYSDTYDAPRSGGRVHKAADIMAPEGAAVVAAVGGRVTWITGVDAPVPSYGYMLRIAGDDGRDYAYVHLGRQDGTPADAYAPGVARDARVERGQLIGFVGCSGNASCSAPHLHFEIHDDAVTDPYGDQRINPYPSLVAAELDGGAPDGGARDGGGDDDRGADRGPGDGGGDDGGGAGGGGGPSTVIDPYDDVSGSVHLPAIRRLTTAGIMEGCDRARFCPDDAIDRAVMAEVLARALDLPASPVDAFADDDGSDAEPAIDALAAAGVVLGCGDGTAYCPDEDVSRARMATYLARAFELPATTLDLFVDDDGHSHEDNINRIAAAGITVGCTADRFCVRAPVTRGQIASLIVRGLDG